MGRSKNAQGNMEELAQNRSAAIKAHSANDWETVLREVGMYLARGGTERRIFGLAMMAAAATQRWEQVIFWAGPALTGAPLAELALERYLYGMALRETVRHVESAEALREAVCSAAAMQDRELQRTALTLLGVEERILGRAAAAAAAYLEAALLAAEKGDAKETAGQYSSYLLCGAIEDEAEFFRAHQGFGELLRPLLPAPLPARAKDLGHKRLRLGILSADFRQHVMFPFLYPLLVYHDRSRFELYCYALNGAEDGHTAQAKQQAEVWREAAGLSPVALAELLRQDEIDIVIDFSGHSLGSGLAALLLRPALLQLSGLGYMATTGLKEIDYFLTDGFLDPPGEGHEQFFAERLLRLESHLCYTGRSDVPVPQGAPVKRKGFITFGVFNHYYKYTDEMLCVWRDILAAVPDSRLLLKCQLFISASAVRMAYERLERLGLPMERVSFEPATFDYMERYLEVDIALDTYPYPGGGTTCDALYMGVPVVSRFGESHGSRFGLSLLRNVGLGELCAATPEEYRARALMLAGDAELLDALHRSLRGMAEKSPMMNGRRWTALLEQRLLEAWEIL